jgi:hypothetical protein
MTILADCGKRWIPAFAGMTILADRHLRGDDADSM